jgi:hypothetical protein
MNQSASVFMPGLTARGPVYSANSPLGAYLSGLPALPPMVIYGAMAAALFAGYKKMIPFGLAGGAALAFGIYELFPSSATSGSGAPTSSDIAASTAGASTIPDLTGDINASVAAMTPSLSGFFNPGIYNRRIRRK